MADVFTVSTDKKKLDLQRIHWYLCNHSYWARGRSFETVERSIEHSVCFGMYRNDEEMIGFGRVVTDFTVFAYMLDVFILKKHRNKHLGNLLIESMLEYPDFNSVTWLLGTKHAHGFYSKLGFEDADPLIRYMRKKGGN